MRPVTFMTCALALVLAGCASSGMVANSGPKRATALQNRLFAAGVQRFMFDGWAGPAFPVWTYRPKTALKEAPVLFVFHGVQRDADIYVDQWIDLAQQHQFILIVPEYNRAAFPGVEAYSHGWFAEKNGTPRPSDKWSFATVEPIFAAVKKREGMSAATYSIYGHSGGAQFVHRYVLAGGGRNLAQAVSANAGSYAATVQSVRWPFGLADVPNGVWNPQRAFAAPMIVLLGTADTDPDHKSLPQQPEAMAQGANRLERGKTFYAGAYASAEKLKAPFNWKCGLVRGIGHDNAGMAGHAVALLFGNKEIEAGSDCQIVE